jgi:Glycosyltransferase family 87
MLASSEFTRSNNRVGTSDTIPPVSQEAGVTNQSPRLRRWSFAVLLGLGIGFCVFIGTSHGVRAINGGRVGGDFAAFYGAGALVRAGQGAGLYDRDKQREVQQEFLPDHSDGWLDFAYPPFVAVLFVPLALFPFKLAFSIYSLAQVGACVGAVQLAATVTPRVRENRVVAAAVTLSFYPLMRSVLGGQNTGFSLLCAVGVAVSLCRSRDFAAGLWAAAWLFKPQLALAVILLGGVRRARGFWAAVVLGGAVWYGLGALVGGLAWPVWWWREGVLPFAHADVAFDLANGISLREVGLRLGVGPLATALSALCLGTAAWRCWSWKGSIVPLIATAIVATLLISPHTLFYDAGLLVVCFWVAVESDDQAVLTLATITWVLASLQVAAPWVPISPAFVSLVSATVMIWLAPSHASAPTGMTPGLR